MLSIIPLLSFLIFSVLYPLCFWLSARDPLKKDFHHFHIGLPNVTAGLSVLGMVWLKIPEDILVKACLWLVLFFLATFVYWKKQTVNPVVITAVSILGLQVYLKTHSYYLGFDPAAVFVSILSGLILSAAFYALNLGHWYLNVHGLPLTHLKRATAALGVLLGVRLLWNAAVFMSASVMYRGEAIGLAGFVTRLDGFFLVIAFFFGTLFPLVSIYFVWGTLKAKSTQSATGILYVLLSAILIGDMAYKYYLLNYNLPL